MPRRLDIAFASLFVVLLSLSTQTRAQRNEDNALSDAEVEQLRESAYFPNDRVLLFIKLLDTRAKAIQDLYAHPRKPGREQDTHDLLEQFTSIADELDDNLDDYSTHHRDVRKALPKVADAAERWASELKSPPDNEAYNVSRKIALEAVRDLREGANELTESQKTWFAAHPPAKENQNTIPEPTEIPR